MWRPPRLSLLGESSRQGDRRRGGRGPQSCVGTRSGRLVDRTSGDNVALDPPALCSVGRSSRYCISGSLRPLATSLDWWALPIAAHQWRSAMTSKPLCG